MKKDSISKYFTRSYLNAENIVRLGVLAVFILQVLFIIFINLFKCRAWIDHDASMLYSHTIHMWEQKKLVIPFYQEETFLHLDTSAIFALPFYAITHDVFLSYGISNVIFVLLTLWVMNDLLKKLDVRDTFRYAAMLLYLIPYRIGLVQYTNMLFFECSFYNVCILCAVLAIDLFLYPDIGKDDKREKTRYIIMLVVYALFTALTAFSRGTYTFLVALLPIILCYCLEVILAEDGFKHIKRSKLIVIAVTVAAYVLGMGYGKLTGSEPMVEGYSLVLPVDLFDNFTRVFWGHLSIFLGVENPEVFTPEGIRILILLAYAFVLIALIIFNMRHAFSEEKHSNALRYLTLIYLWNCAICGVTSCSDGTWAYPERYLFPGFIPLLLSVPVILTYIENAKRELLRRTLFACATVLACAVLIVCDFSVRRSFRQNGEELQGIREVLSYAKENGVDTVFFLNDDNGGLLSRSLDTTLHVIPILAGGDGTYELRSRENYMCAADRAYYGDENIMAVKWDEQPEEAFLDYQLSSYQYVGDVKDYHLYRAGSNKFDGRAGFPLDDNVLDKSIDFCHTAGYQIAGETDLYGYLEATGEDNYVLLSPLLEGPYTDCNVTLRYETGHKTAEEPDNADAVPHTIGTLQLLDETNTPIASAEIQSDADTAVVTAPQGKSCYVAVYLNAGEKITLQQTDFEVIK